WVLHAACRAARAWPEGRLLAVKLSPAEFLRGQLGRRLDMKFTPDLRFRHDDSFDAASHMDRLFADPRIQADLAASDDENEQ
ncbi:ribosome-binding factor A, partial [Mesorhizobium japonicum]|uniref:ribosome-binding factor A n=1 Tax=Mesorhizobium japonicum TaxID=2066070 RepID=UPI003B591ADC